MTLPKATEYTGFPSVSVITVAFPSSNASRASRSRCQRPVPTSVATLKTNRSDVLPALLSTQSCDQVAVLIVAERGATRAKTMRAVANIPSAISATRLGSVRTGCAFSVNELQTDSAVPKSALSVSELHADSATLKTVLLRRELHADLAMPTSVLFVNELHADFAALTSVLLAGHFTGTLPVGEEPAIGVVTALATGGVEDSRIPLGDRREHGVLVGHRSRCRAGAYELALPVGIGGGSDAYALAKPRPVQRVGEPTEHLAREAHAGAGVARRDRRGKLVEPRIGHKLGRERDRAPGLPPLGSRERVAGVKHRPGGQGGMGTVDVVAAGASEGPSEHAGVAAQALAAVLGDP